MTTDLILGTAGHIDHGKTSLIRALTGVDTDRLPEEKRRGITIELGFAELVVGPYRLGIVDVPGHERFVRNMLAGATGMDLAVLVVAADDSVKPQTREHLDILRLLHLQAGLVALTKCDLVEPQWLELVEEEVRELVAGTFLEGAPIVRTSTHARQGLDELREELGRCAERAAGGERTRMLEGPFRMAIDRTFTIAGHGTVVTGSVGSGRVAVGDELEIQPGAIRVRVRGLQNHDRLVERVQRGQRAAINLVGIHHGQVERGQELASPGHLVPSRLLSAQVRLLPDLPRPLKHRSRLRVHVGTAELLASVVLVEGRQVEPGGTAFVQLLLSRPAVTTWNQPLVLRSESPLATIGGGQVLDPNAARLRRDDPRIVEQLGRLSSPEAVQRASAALYFRGLREFRPEDLFRTAGIEPYAEAYEALRERGDVREIALSPTRVVRVHRLVLEELGERVARTLARFHEDNPLRLTMPRSQLAHKFRYLPDPALLDVVLAGLEEQGVVRRASDGVALAGHGPKLSQNEQKLLRQLIEAYRQAGIEPPTVKQVQEKTGRNQQVVLELIRLAAANGELVQITADMYLDAGLERDIRERLAARLSESGNGLTMSEIRDILNTSRKYAVPICEYLDRIGFTLRSGDVRTLASSATG